MQSVSTQSSTLSRGMILTRVAEPPLGGKRFSEMIVESQGCHIETQTSSRKEGEAVISLARGYYDFGGDITVFAAPPLIGQKFFFLPTVQP